MANNNTYKRPILPWGNSFYLNISLQRYEEGQYVDFDLTKVTDLKAYLICATHNTEIPLPYEILPGYDNILKCFVDYRLLHTTSYGIVVDGYDEEGMHFRFEMLPKEGFLIVNNTSGMYVTDDVQVIDISGRVGWGISTEADLTNYYTKVETNALLDEKVDTDDLATVATSGDYNDLSNKPDLSQYATEQELSQKQDTLVSGTNIKTINGNSLLGSGNIDIQSGTEQVQADWTETDTSSKAYIQHKPTIPAAQVNSDWNSQSGVSQILNKPDLSQYATQTDLNSYYTKTETNSLLDKKADTSDLASKQDTLVSGTNIKTINGNSLLGSGDLVIGDEENPYERQYFTFEAVNDAQFWYWTRTTTGQAYDRTIQYSLDDGETWQTLQGTTDTSDIHYTPVVQQGEHILFKSNGTTHSTGGARALFNSTAEFIVYGNVMSLLYGDNFYGKKDLQEYLDEHTGELEYYQYPFVAMFSENEYITDASNLVLPATTLTEGCYYRMFETCTSLTAAPKILPATTLANSCYSSMFARCSSLTTPPELPATTLSYQCYMGMFTGCASLTTAPALPATTLAQSCYSNMFNGCISLATAPALPATTLAQECYSGMFERCTSLRTVQNILPATTLANNCYASMFRDCTVLAIAPELPAMALTEICYTSMFENCTTLTTAPELPATRLDYMCYTAMFRGCTSLTKAPSILPATTLDPATSCYKDMFYGCTSLTTAPELPAAGVFYDGYHSMFEGCTSLNYIKCLATDISINDCTLDWVKNVSATGTFVKDDNMSSWTTGLNGIPQGWTTYTDTEYSYARHYELPQSQGVQSDWNETDPTSLAYIQNKPNVLTAFAQGKYFIETHTFEISKINSTTYRIYCSFTIYNNNLQKEFSTLDYTSYSDIQTALRNKGWHNSIVVISKDSAMNLGWPINYDAYIKCFYKDFTPEHAYDSIAVGVCIGSSLSRSTAICTNFLPTRAVVYSGSYNDLSNKPTIPSTSGMVTGYDGGVITNNLKIDVVSALPTPTDPNTIYIIA